MRARQHLDHFLWSPKQTMTLPQLQLILVQSMKRTHANWMVNCSTPESWMVGSKRCTSPAQLDRTAGKQGRGILCRAASTESFGAAFKRHLIVPTSSLPCSRAKEHCPDWQPSRERELEGVGGH